MSLTRRLFARNAPIATAAAGMALGGKVNPAPPSVSNIPAGAYIGMDAMVEDPLAIPRRAFREAMRTQKNPTSYARRVQDWQRMSPNIQALKSVSEQHKIRMMFDHMDKLDEEQQSWAKKIADAVGFTEFGHTHDLY